MPNAMDRHICADCAKCHADEPDALWPTEIQCMACYKKFGPPENRKTASERPGSPKDDDSILTTILAWCDTHNVQFRDNEPYYDLLRLVKVAIRARNDEKPATDR